MEDLVNNLCQIYKGKRVLVTGHNGFKGTWLVALLNYLGAEVYGVSLAIPSDSPFKDFHSSQAHRSIEQDIRDAESLNKIVTDIQPEIIFHLAAQALVLESYLKPLETFEVNIIGTANVLEAAKHTMCLGVVVATTDKVYKNENSGTLFKETDELWGHDPYSLSKTGSELVVSAWRNLPEMEHCKIVTVRAGNVFGPGDHSANRLLPDLQRARRHRNTVTIRNPDSIRPWQFVLDALLGYLLVGERIITKSNLSVAYNFGPAPTSFVSVLEFVGIFNKYAPVKFKISRDSLGLESEVLKLDSSLAQTELGWNPLTGLDEGIKISAQDNFGEMANEAVIKIVNDYLSGITNPIL